MSANKPVNTKALRRQLEESVRNATNAVLLEFRGDVTELLYKKENPPPLFNKPSKPGKPPATRFGAAGLAGSIAVQLAKRRGNKFAGKVGANKAYAADLEYGAPTRKLLPRPFMRPTLKKNEKRYMRILAQEMGRQMQRLIK